MAVWALCLLFLALTSSLSIISADELALVVGQSVTLHTLPSFLVKKSPGSKPGSVVFAERVKIYGLPRINNLKRFSHSVKVKVSHLNSSLLQPNVEVCFHRNLSLGVGMCPQGQWEKLSNGLWVRTMSPFDNKLLDIRMIGSSSDVLSGSHRRRLKVLHCDQEVTIQLTDTFWNERIKLHISDPLQTSQYFLVYRVAFLVLGMVLLVLASTLGKSLVFYYSSAMAVGIILVILMVLFQGMKLLPTGRKTSLAIFMYSSLVGVGSFLLSYSSKLLLAMLSEMGISEDVYNPLAIFLLLFVALAGAWLGFWAVRKLILTEDGSVDASVSLFVAWSIRTIAAVMILQCSLDPLLAATALIFAILVSSMLRRATRLRLLRRLYRKFLKAAKSSPLKSRNNDPNGAYTVYPNNFHWSKDTILRPHSRQPSLALRNSLSRGPATTPPWQMSDSETFYSTFYETPERRKFTKDEWEKFTKGCTKKALEELVSSPDFNKWAVANAERITLTSTKKDDSITSWRPQRWFFWVQ